MQTSESAEGPSAYNSLTHLGKPTQVWVYTGKHPNNKTMKFHCRIS